MNITVRKYKEHRLCAVSRRLAVLFTICLTVLGSIIPLAATAQECTMNECRAACEKSGKQGQDQAVHCAEKCTAQKCI